ncbi:hypothetical protein SLE2022_058220 [Rubroshorea leprosula]
MDLEEGKDWSKKENDGHLQTGVKLSRTELPLRQSYCNQLRWSKHNACKWVGFRGVGAVFGGEDVCYGAFACHPLVAMPSIATFPTGLLGSAPSLRRPVIALDAISS